MPKFNVSKMHGERQVAARAKFPRLYAWAVAAQRSGQVYARCDVSRSGMQAKVLLWTIRTETGRKAWLDVAWPDDGAKVAGFSVKRRAFVVGGCGFDRVDHVLDGIFYLFGLDRSGVRDDVLNQPA